MTKSQKNLLYIGLAAGSAVLLAACQMPSLSQTARTSVTVEASPDALNSYGQPYGTTTQPPTITNTTVDQDLQSLDTLSQQSNPAVLGASEVSNTSLGIQ